MTSAESRISTFTESHLSTLSPSSSAWHHSTIEGAGLKKEVFKDRLRETKQWLFNSEEGLLMGRPVMDWIFVTVGYFLFFVTLLGMSAVFCGLFYWFVDWNKPELKGPEAMLMVPGMGFRPQPRVDSTLIRYVKSDANTFSHYIDHIEAYIGFYENELQQGDNFMDCSAIQDRRDENDNDKACVFDVKDLGIVCVKQQVYGFGDGQPCILLKLNKVFDWVPEEYTSDTVPDEISDVWTNPWSVLVKCDGDDAVTRENMGDLSYYPSDGFHFKYFPFRNQQGYRSPLVFLRFENPTPGILLMMTCKAYARNIVHNNVEKMGQIHFEVMID